MKRQETGDRRQETEATPHVLRFTFYALAALLWGGGTFPVQAASRITATVTFTNTPSGTNAQTVVVNGDTRTWTNNVVAAGTQIPSTNSPGTSATNYFRQIAGAPYAGPIVSSVSGTNVTLIGATDLAMSVTFGGSPGYASVSYATQTVSVLLTVRVPLSAEAANVRSNIASLLVTAITDHATNAFPTNAAALSNYANLGPLPQRLENKILTNASFQGGTISNATPTKLLDGYWTNAVIDRPNLTNGINRGAAFSSRGTGGSGSEQFGASAVATAVDSLAVGGAASATGGQSTSIGTLSQASAVAALALGKSAVASSDSALALGSGANASATNALAIGVSATVAHNDSTAIGVNVASTTNNQVRLGTATQTVSIPGSLTVDGNFLLSGSQSNMTFRGTNILNGRLDLKSSANAGLANGNNAGVVLGTNAYLRLSGGSTIVTIAGFAAEQDGSFHVVQISGAVTNILANESGVDATPANRIVTGTGGDLALTNNPAMVQMIYDATATRWRVLSWTR